MTKLTKTVTTSIKSTQQTLLKESKDKQHLLKEEDIAEALAERNVLRLTDTLQISSNKQFLAITFQNTQIMESFCTEPLLVRGFNNTFRPKKDFPKKRKTLLNISFPNIPAKTPDEPLTEYLSQFANIVGNPQKSKKKNMTEYHTTLVLESARLIDFTNIYHVTSTICLDKACYASTTTN